MGERAERAERAVRVTVTGRSTGEVVTLASEAGVLGWVREEDDGFLLHAEGAAAAVEDFVTSLGGEAETEDVKAEGHEQFAVRGVPAGAFVVQDHELRLEVDGVMRCWAVPKDPSMDPAQKRMAIQIADRQPGDTANDAWDSGTYEQGGRVPWPEAIERGHAVFVLHGKKLKGGFALQRIRDGEKPQWLLIKRKDEHAKR